MLRTCFSTVPSVTQSSCEIALLERPSAWPAFRASRISRAHPVPADAHGPAGPVLYLERAEHAYPHRPRRSDVATPFPGSRRLAATSIGQRLGRVSPATTPFHSPAISVKLQKWSHPGR
jgi:hypothetical protein